MAADKDVSALISPVELSTMTQRRYGIARREFTRFTASLALGPYAALATAKYFIDVTRRLRAYIFRHRSTAQRTVALTTCARRISARRA